MSCLVLFVRNCWNGGSSDSRAGDSRAERPSTADGQRGGTDDTAGAGGSNGSSLWEPKVGVDTRNLGRPSQFNGDSACGTGPALVQLVERLPTAETNAGLLDDEQVQASTDLYHLHLHSTLGPALDRVVNAGIGRRALCLARSRTTGQLLSLLQFDFSGGMLAKLEAYERDLALYEQASGEKISDGLRVGIVPGAYQTRRGVNDPSTAPMERDALQQHGDKRYHTSQRFPPLEGLLAQQEQEQGQGFQGQRWQEGQARGRPTKTSA